MGSEMGWFRRKKKLDANGEALAFRIAGEVLAYQRKVADRLNGKAKGWGKKKVVAMLVVLGVLFGAYCLWLVCGL
jgi:hypothetical protein